MEDRFFVLSRECCDAYSDEEGPSDCRLLLSRFNTPHVSSFEIEVLGHKLFLSQDPNSRHLGTTVWDSSLVFAKFMERNSKKGEFSRAKISGKRVIELGAGCGLAGLGGSSARFSGILAREHFFQEGVCEDIWLSGSDPESHIINQAFFRSGDCLIVSEHQGMFWHHHVRADHQGKSGRMIYAMDLKGSRQVAVLPILLRNVERNLARARYTSSDNGYQGSIGNVEVAELDWGNEAHVAAVEPPFDYIIGTDVVYVEHLLEPLMTSILSLAGPKTTVILGYEFRSSGVREQLHELCKKHFHVKKVLHAKMDPKYQHPNIDLYILRRIDTSTNNGSRGSSEANGQHDEVGRSHAEPSSDASNENRSPSSKQEGDTREQTCHTQKDGVFQAVIEDELSSDEEEFCGIPSSRVHKNGSTSSRFNNIGNQRRETSRSQPSDWEIRRLGSSVARLMSEVSPPSA